MLTSLQRRLEDYPDLERWYSSQNLRNHIEHPISQFIWSLCHGLKGHNDDLIDQLPEILEALMKSSEDLKGDVQKIEATLAQDGLRLNELLSEACEVAIHRGQGPVYFDLIRKVADRTDLVIFRFVSAWMALNLGDPKGCIEECEKVENPLSHVAVLQGQALLDLGQLPDAIQSFKLAAQLAPADLLAKFQLAKSLYVLRDYTEAWEILGQCRRISSGNGEVALLTGVVCAEAGFTGERAQTAWSLLSPHLQGHSDHVELVLCLLRLCILTEDEKAFLEIIPQVKWTAMGGSSVFMRALSTLLRGLHKLEWHDATADFLARLT